MATAVQVAGASLVRFAFPSAALADLGYTRNGSNIVYENFYHNVPGDEYGGDEGPPIDVQYLGGIARIRLELTKYDAAVAATLMTMLSGATYGQPAASGTLMFSGAKTCRIVIVPSGGTAKNFPRCVIARSPIEINVGTKYSTLFVELEAHKNASGVLEDSTTTGTG